MEGSHDLNLKATELTLGLPGVGESEKNPNVGNAVGRNSKRALPEEAESSTDSNSCLSNADSNQDTAPPPPKAQVVGWPPVRSYRKICLNQSKKQAEGAGVYVKVSVDGAPFLRKIDLKVYKSYPELLKALENLFHLKIGEYLEREGYKKSEYEPTYEDKDGDWMLVGDVPWDMFVCSCKRLRIMRGSEAKGLGCI